MSNGDKVNILLVDDQPARLLSYETILGELGENLVQARSGAEALQLLMKQSFAVVLLDVNMPEMDGFEVATMIHQHPRFEKIPIIFVTAVHVTDLDRLKGYKLGAVDYIYVPVVPEILRSKVAVFVELYRQRQELQRLNAQLDQRVRERTVELEATNKELVRSNAELQRFAYVASHDLQEPLRMVTSYLDLLTQRYQGRLDARADKYIDYAVDGARRMQTLIDDLLTFSRVDSQARPLEPTDCEAVLNQVLANLRPTIQEKSAVVSHDPLPVVPADPTQLTQTFQNLIGNALKFCEGPPRVHIGSQCDGDEWVFSVRDNGIGIAPEYLERIFVLFQRLHTRSKYSGTGIGLAICKKVVERLGGRIWAESRPGQGSVFSFAVPANNR